MKTAGLGVALAAALWFAAGGLWTPARAGLGDSCLSDRQRKERTTFSRSVGARSSRWLRKDEVSSETGLLELDKKIWGIETK